jgi:hypothetical protein
MKVADINTAVPLLAKRADLLRRMKAVSSAETLSDVYQTLVGTGLEDNILSQSRQQVSDFLQVAVNDLNEKLRALGVDFSR